MSSKIQWKLQLSINLKLCKISGIYKQGIEVSYKSSDLMFDSEFTTKFYIKFLPNNWTIFIIYDINYRFQEQGNAKRWIKYEFCFSFL